jgi:hypothetical protein
MFFIVMCPKASVDLCLLLLLQFVDEIQMIEAIELNRNEERERITHRCILQAFPYVEKQ